MNEWASKLRSVFPDRPRADFNKFINEIRAENLEYMSSQKDLDEEVDIRPSFEQLDGEKINEESNRNIQVLKSLEVIIQERIQSYQLFLTHLSKSRSSFEVFQDCEGTLRQALDSLFVYVEQELQQARQQLTMGDVRKTLGELRVEAQKCLTDYQKELHSKEKEVALVEKRIQKFKEQLEKLLDSKAKLEHTDSLGRHGRELRFEKLREIDENIAKCDRETKEESRLLLRMLTSRDNILSASRRAYQSLDTKCKQEIIFSLKKLVSRERESNFARNAVLEKLEMTINNVDIDGDLTDFIATHACANDGLILQSQALSMMADLNPESKKGNIDLSGSPPPFSTKLTGSSNISSVKTFASTSQTVEYKTLMPSGGYGNEEIGNLGSSFQHQSIGRSISNRDISIREVSYSSSDSRDTYCTREAIVISPRDFSESVDPSTNLLSSVAGSSISVHGGDTISIGSMYDASSAHSSAVQVSSLIKSVMSSNQQQSTANSGGETVTINPAFGSRNPAANKVPVVINFNENQSTVCERFLEIIFHRDEDVLQNFLNANASEDSGMMSLVYSPLDIVRYCQRRTQATTVEDSSNSGIITGRSITRAVASFSYPGVVNSAAGVCTNINPCSEDAVAWLAHLIETQEGRSIFTAELNKFRSKQVNIGKGFSALGAVLWAALLQCQLYNDVHSAKIIMMLSQTFYRLKEGSVKKRQDGGPPPSRLPTRDHSDSPARCDSADGDEEEQQARDTNCREYLKDALVNNPLWGNGNFWEQALWQCAIEQLQTVPYEMPWYDMDLERRTEIVLRVHNIIFSQVMAIMHSMMELGCSSKMTREFVYRMCVIHQLSEVQRQQLLRHLLHGS